MARVAAKWVRREALRRPTSALRFTTLGAKTRFSSTVRYIAPPDLAVAVKAAVVPEQPLLVRGDPGTGKTEPARQMAASLELPILEWHVKSATKAQKGLYEYDAVSRLGDARVNDVANCIRRGKLWQAFTAPGRLVR